MGFKVYFDSDRTVYYDSNACTVFFGSDTEEISGNTKKILEFLIEHRNSAMTRAQIQEYLYDVVNYMPERNPVDTAISLLRKKLRQYRTVIKTVNGVGYKYIGPEKEKSAVKEIEAAGLRIQTNSSAYTIIDSGKNDEISAAKRQKNALLTVKNSLGSLAQAKSAADTDTAKKRIEHAINFYVQTVGTEMRILQSKSAMDSTMRESEIEKYRDEIFDALWEYSGCLSPQDGLYRNKEAILGYECEWFLTIAFLKLQIRLEQEAYRLAESELEKEIEKTLIVRLNDELSFAREESATAYADGNSGLDNGYSLDVSENRR